MKLIDRLAPTPISAVNFVDIFQLDSQQVQLHAQNCLVERVFKGCEQTRHFPFQSTHPRVRNCIDITIRGFFVFGDCFGCLGLMAPLNWQLTTIKDIRYMRNATLVENALLQENIAPLLCHSGG